MRGADARWLSSPLRRATETAALLTDRPVTLEPRLIEMDWGAWEGRTLAGSARRDARRRWRRTRPAASISGRPAARARAKSGPRLESLLADLADDLVVCVTHKGVIRAALSLATGWDMLSKPPLRLTDDAALISGAATPAGSSGARPVVPLVDCFPG